MIRVNLLSGSQTSNSAFAAKDGGLAEAKPKGPNKAAVHFVAILLFPTVLFLYEFSIVPDLRAEDEKIQLELTAARDFNAKYLALTEELKKFEEDRQKLNAQIGAVESLSVDRLKVVRALDAIQTLIPEKAWLSRIAYDYINSSLLIEGLAVGDLDVTGFLEALSRSVYFKQVDLMRSQEVVFEEKPAKRFEIALTMEQAKWPQK